ncbi:MAG: AroM family protein [Alphaproteobacteria bacterium]|nr:AroM family protein [Alphaproteobacteria bacterium]
MGIPRIGALVVGQSPRPEVERELRALAGVPVQLDLRGCLDGLSRAEIEALKPVDDADTLFTRLPNGDGVTLSKKEVVAHGTAKLQSLAEAGYDVTMVMCTGEFPDWIGRFKVLFPSRTLNAMVKGCLPSGRLGVFTPLAEQCAKSRKRWSEAGYDAQVVALSPNAGPDQVRAAAESLRDHAPELLVLDCISYTRETKAIMREVLGVPAILAVSSTVRTALEMAG